MHTDWRLPTPAFTSHETFAIVYTVAIVIVGLILLRWVR